MTPEGLTTAEYQEIVSDAAADARTAQMAYWGSGVLVFVLVGLVVGLGGANVFSYPFMNNAISYIPNLTTFKVEQANF